MFNYSIVVWFRGDEEEEKKNEYSAVNDSTFISKLDLPTIR